MAPLPTLRATGHHTCRVLCSTYDQVLGDSATRRFAELGKSKFSGLDQSRAIELLNMLDSAPSLQAISPLRSVGLHKLKGGRKGQWAIAVNGPWRICFRFRDGNAYDVEITDYH